jgi:hypothetical protein
LQSDEHDGGRAQDERHKSIDHPRVQCQEPRFEPIEPAHAGEATAAPLLGASSVAATRILLKQDPSRAKISIGTDDGGGRSDQVSHQHFNVSPAGGRNGY